MLAFALLVALAPAPAPAATAAATPKPGVELLVLDLRAIGVDDDEARIVGGLVTAEVLTVARGWALPVSTGDDLRTLVSVDATQRAAGCDDASCMAEIAGAFGAAHVVTGSLGVLGGDRVLQLWLMDVAAGRTIARVSVVGEDARALTSGLHEGIVEVLAPLAPTATTPGKAAAKKRVPAKETSALAVAGGVVATVGTLSALGLGAWAFVLDERLAAGSSAASFEKRDALESGPWVVLGAATAGVVAVSGGVLLGIGVSE